MNILGISAFYHDSAAALVCDGEIIAAAQEERFTRRKHDPAFPKHAIAYCLREAKISRGELAAKFDVPQSLALDAKGRLYIGDEHNHAIRVVERDGIIRTLIGCYGPGFSGDRLAASSAQLNDPEDMWVRTNGSLLITDRCNGRRRMFCLGQDA
jgi:hypothetical protein